MRYWPTTAAEAAISQLSAPPPPPPAAPVAATDNIPATDANDGTDDASTTILIICLSMVVTGVALHTAIRLFLEKYRANRQRSWEREKAAELSAAVASVTSTVAHGGGDAAAECAICLAEFEEGEEIKVPGNCRHGFHGRCIERWFAASWSSSCPTCRRSSLPPTTTLPPAVVSSPITAGGGG
ncbi:unnamed protein product [Linum trigynum]|uniref:RING-type domain-containing protein n=1 Tax=Linum trigynum TaxID=586398 RepID=A0AAV2D3I3_9ROSI